MTHRIYSFAGLDGCVVQRRAQQTGTLVGVYNSEQAGLEDDMSCAWMTVCEAHGVLVGHTSMRTAVSWAADPASWCEWCRARHNRYTVVDDHVNNTVDALVATFTLDEFLFRNDNLDEYEKQQVRDLKVDHFVRFGGGAAAEMTIRRVA